MSDGNGELSVATAAINITAVNDAPRGSNGSSSTAEDTPITAALPVVTDVEGATLTYTVVTNPTNGTVSIAPNGNFTYTPNAHFNGHDSFTYEADDGSGETATFTQTITVTPVNDAPTLTSNGGGATASISINERIGLGATVLTTVAAVDPDAGDARVYSIAGGADAAAFTINATTGELSFITGPDYENPADDDDDNIYQVRVRVTDGAGAFDEQALTVTVNDLSVFEGSAEADTIMGDNGHDTISGLAAGDMLDGFLGDDDIDGGARQRHHPRRRRQRPGQWWPG